MPLYILEYSNKDVKYNEAIERDLSWYDSETKQMMRGKGTSLSFTYDTVAKKMIPNIVTGETQVVYKRENNSTGIKDWIESVGKKFFNVIINDRETNSTGLAIVFDKDVTGMLEESLDNYNIRFREL